MYKKGKKGIEAGKKAVGKVKEKVIQKVANIKVKDIAKVAGAVIAPRATAAAKLSQIASKTIRKKFKKKDDEKRKGAEKATMYQQGGQIEEAGEMQKKRKPGKSLKRKLKKTLRKKTLAEYATDSGYLTEKEIKALK